MAETLVLAGKYRLVSLLGRGGMGEVWRAEHLGLGAPVAVKLMDPSVASNPEALGRFHREAQAAAALRSPHVVQVLDHGVEPTTHSAFIVMELMDGESLAQRLARIGHLAPADTARVVAHVARALSRAHEARIVHRDLKPDNVFLVANEDEEIAKVLDFGIAKAHAGSGMDAATRTGALLGTPYYMSPEQISGSKGVDFRADLWALAVIACECLTGRRPFEASSIGGLALKICAEPIAPPSSLGPVPPGFDAWFARGAARDPEQRFQSARELADSLRRLCELSAAEGIAGAPGHGPAAGSDTYTKSTAALSRTMERSPELPVRRAFGWITGGALLVLIGGGAAIWSFTSRAGPVAGSTKPVSSSNASESPTARARPLAGTPTPLPAPKIEAVPTVTMATSTAPPPDPPAATRAPKRPAPVPTAAQASASAAIAPRQKKAPVTTAKSAASARPGLSDVIDNRR